jgi:hypothetical protein
MSRASRGYGIILKFPQNGENKHKTTLNYHFMPLVEALFKKIISEISHKHFKS